MQYNRTGGTVKLSCESRGEERVISVAYDGPGIDPQLVSRVFDAFSRGQAGDDAQHLGLGLAIVQSHVKALGGRCEVESRPCEGTTFRVLLPGASQPRDLAESRQLAESAEAVGAKVLSPVSHEQPLQ